MTLDQIKPGRGGVIAAIGGEGALRRRLLDMGLTPGTFVHVRRVAPMGDPMELVLRGYVLTLRMDDAAKIQLRETAPAPLEAPPGCPACGRCAPPLRPQGRGRLFRRRSPLGGHRGRGDA